MAGFDLDTLALGAAAVATVLAAVGALPQLRRVVRTGDVRGVSLTMVTLNAASEVGWFTHFAGRGQWAAIPASFVIVGTYGALGVALSRAGGGAQRPVAIGCGWAAALVATRLAVGPGALATLLAATKVAQVTPQVWTAWRTSRPTGVSATMWVIAGVEAALWAGYGAVYGDIALVSLGAVGLTAGIAILIRVVTIPSRGIPRSGCPVVTMPELPTMTSSDRAQDNRAGPLDRAA